MQVLVDKRMVKTAVDKVDPEVGKYEEEWELSPVVPGWPVCEGVVELGVAANFGKEERHGEEGYPGHCRDSLSYFHSNLVLEELGMLKSGFIEYENVRKC